MMDFNLLKKVGANPDENVLKFDNNFKFNIKKWVKLLSRE
jgi:hypothetical protein